MSKVNRRLATILATDCVGFSKFMEADEEGTLLSLKACRAIIDNLIEEHGGRIFHTAGDSVLAEFNSTVECLNAAKHFQEALNSRAEKLIDAAPLVWRVGIHVDDILVEADNVYGRGVNIAARLEAHCEPGQILVSRIVREQVQKRVSFAIQAAGSRSLKNISDEFEVFSVVDLSSIDHEKADPELSKTQAQDIKKSVTSVRSKPRLAILPFENNSRESDAGFLVDGIVEDLITEFSMIRELDVLSRATTTEFKNSDADALTFASNFSSDFVVMGGIRSSGSRIRINVELIDATSGSVLWSQKYDRVMDDVFDIQDQIVRAITIRLLGEIELNSLGRAKRKPTENISSYEFLLRAKEQHHLFTAEANKKALEFIDKAILLDEGNAQAHAWKTCTLGQGMYREYFNPEEIESAQTNAIYHLNKALELNENDFEVHRMLSAVYLSNHEYDKAAEHGLKAFQLNPNDPRVLSGTGEVLVRVNQQDQGLDMLEKALALDPVPMGQTTSDNRFKDLVLGYFLANKLEQCIETAKALVEFDERSWLLLMRSYQLIGLAFSESTEFAHNAQRFKGLDWQASIDRFHIPSVGVRSDLMELAQGLNA
jgi:adenylate cyclase